VDSFSVDRTAEIATSLGARVVEVPFNGFGDLRNRAIEVCKCDWIFSLDADERCTEALRDEILALIAGTPAHDVYRVPRRSYMMGRWIRGSGWYPNFRQPQLFRKGAMRYELDPVHEGFENLSGKRLGTLKNTVWQFPFRNMEEVIKKMNRYSSLGVQNLADKRVSMAGALGHGLGRSSSTTSSNLASLTGGPASSSRSAISKGLSTATPSDTSSNRTGSRREVNRLDANSDRLVRAQTRQLITFLVRVCARPSRWSNARARSQSGSPRRQAPRRRRGRRPVRAYSRYP